MRAATIAALREYYADLDDATALPRLVVDEGGVPVALLDRLPRLVLRALREIEQDRQADAAAATAALQNLRQRVAALEAKLP